MKKKKTYNKNKNGGCLPCAAAAGPAGVAIATLGTAGYYGYKKMKGGSGKFKKNEKILYVQNDGSTYQAKFRRYISPNKASIKLLSRKALTPLITVNIKKLRTIKKTIMNTRKRQKDRRADTVRRKRNLTPRQNKTDEGSSYQRYQKFISRYYDSFNKKNH